DDDGSPPFPKKKRERVYFFKWEIELFGRLDNELSGDTPDHNSEELINRQVRKAVKKLSYEERKFIEKFYFEFKSYQEIAGILKKRIYKLERIHRRALDKMRILLADFVKERFKLEVSQKTDCVICNSPFRQELDELIKNKKKAETYSRLIRTFKQKYELDIKTPQVIIGHQRKHMI
ncbi:MAG TPA: hypothetical protein VF369_06680, partial [candidate division Zixibacteria bacterium]